MGLILVHTDFGSRRSKVACIKCNIAHMHRLRMYVLDLDLKCCARDAYSILWISHLYSIGCVFVYVFSSVVLLFPRCTGTDLFNHLSGRVAKFYVFRICLVIFTFYLFYFATARDISLTGRLCHTHPAHIRQRTLRLGYTVSVIHAGARIDDDD